jgi:hypothetical protein
MRRSSSSAVRPESARSDVVENESPNTDASATRLRSTGSSASSRDAIRLRRVSGIARVANEHAGELGGFVMVRKP